MCEVTKRMNKMKKEKKIKEKKIKENKGQGNSFFGKIKSRLTQVSRFLSNKFEQLFTNSKFTVVVTLILAVLLVQSVQSAGSVTLIKQVSALVRDREVTAEYDRDKFVVEGLPATANVMLIGDEAAIQSTKATNSYSVFIDLTSYGAGDHVVSLDVENLPTNVTAQVNPNKVSVSIFTKEFKVFNITPEVINENAIEGLSIENPVLSESTVSLKGATKDLKRVAFVRALIDGKSINASLTDRSEGIFEGRATIAAYDDQGNRISNLTVDTGGVDFTVNLAAPKGKPISNLNSIFSGNFPEGQAIRNVTLDTEVVTINGADAEIAKVTELDINFDLKSISGDGKIEGTVAIPSGVTLTGVTPEKVIASLEFGPAVTKEVNVSGISKINANDQFNYTVDDPATQIVVSVIGTEEQLAIFDQNMIDVRADVANLGEGIQQVSLTVKGPSVYRYKLSQENVRLRITKK